MWAVSPIAPAGEYGEIVRDDRGDQITAGASKDGAGASLGGALPPG